MGRRGGNESLGENLAPGSVAVLGIPYDENSSFMRGPARAPARIREMLHSGSANMCAENEHDLGADPRLQDVGDLALSSGPAVLEEIERGVSHLLDQGARVLALGGDHAVTYPIVQAYAARYTGLNILHLDAHPDLYEEFEGSRFSHACPFARIMEAGLVSRLVQVGIRTITPHLRDQIERFGVQVITAGEWGRDVVVALDGPVYLSLDLDVLDPAYAPGTSHHEPGGLSTRDIITVIQELHAPPVGADIVEFNPERDPLGVTAMVAAKLLKEIAARMLKTEPKEKR
jgi:arginase